MCALWKIVVSVGVHCVCTVLLFDETSKNNLTFGVAADGSERQGSQFLIFGSLYKPFGRGLSVFYRRVDGLFMAYFCYNLGYSSAIGGEFCKYVVLMGTTLWQTLGSLALR